MDEGHSNKTAFLGTTRGLFVSTGGVSWSLIQGGLPAGPVEQWLRNGNVWCVSERDGGLYISRDSGASWKRVDGDAERSYVTGLVGLREGTILVGSQSEGLLRLDLEDQGKPAKQ